MHKTKSWIFLFIAIISEVIATLSLKISSGAVWGYITMGFFIVISYYFMALCVRIIPIGTAYAIWEAFGLSLIAIVGIIVFGEKITLYQEIGIVLGVIGIVLINLGEKK
ncbi:DMT family transporter [Helicobacter cappadocius]|uniref:Spermidine export protein MdtJ n=1 Tax=Helicobacter cappadocius TaxID=3063998 RepID=A0AA90SSW7_9HELI|nr:MULTISPECIES: multidrug efflux SMR transporter [unclassified Helicobacter]MDO7253462.1 multidrug efflux SMR transporter [Helicobacter sp. faydin-H75]MDP2539389.1 multidrug efflux SMR transporter [Helicobacter sp. faydin-H76]